MSKAHPSLGSLGFPEVTHKPKALGSLASGPDVVLILMHNILDEGFSVPAHTMLLLQPPREDVLQTYRGSQL